MQINPMQLLSMIKGGQNPQQLMLQILESNMTDNPMAQNLLALAKQNNTPQIESIARNLCKERGIDFDKEFQAFCQQLGLK